jgi:hypothetical protein
MPLIRLVDIIPNSDSGESNQNSEPSIGVNPANPMQMFAGSYGPTTADLNENTFFFSTDGGVTWSRFGTLEDDDKSIAWKVDGSAVVVTPLLDGPFDTYSVTLTDSGFGSPINEYVGSNNNDQPWVRTGPSNHVYVAFNDLGRYNPPGDGKTASVNVSIDGGARYTTVTLDRLGAGAGQDDPAVRLAVNGNRVYAVFDRWTTTVENDADGSRYNSQLVVVRSDDGGADGFTALGTGGNGVTAATHVGVFSDVQNTPLTIGRERIAGGDLAIAVDPNNADHVVVAYTDAPGADGAGVVQLVVTESINGGATWTQKFSTPSATRSGQPGIAILANGAIGLLYNNYDPATNQLSQHLLTTSNDFVGTSDTILASESNSTPAFQFHPYLGDFFDLTAIGDTFYGIFSASNRDDGTDAQFANVSFLRNFTGTPGTSNFRLTDANGNPVGFSIDPFLFGFQLQLVPVIGAIGIAAVGDFNSNGNPDFVWRDSSASLSMFEYDATAQSVSNTGLGTVGSGWSILGGAHFSNASTSQMLTDYTPNGTMTLWWVSNGTLTGVDLGQNWPNIGFITNAQFTDNGGANISDFLVTNLVDHHLYDWWIDGNNTLQGIDLGPYWSNVAIVAPSQFTANGGTNLLVNNILDNHLYDWWIDANNTLQGIDLGPYWSNVAAVATGQFVANTNTNLLVTNTLDHHLYDWWISDNGVLQGTDLGAYWSNVQLVTVGRFDNNSSNTQMLVRNTLDHHLYEWWITAQGQLTGIDLGLYWVNVELMGNGHYNNASANDQLLIHNTADGHFYEWWIANNQLQGVDLGLSVSTAGNASSGTVAAPSVPASPTGSTLTANDGTTSLLVQAMASFGTNGAVANSNSALLGPDPSQQSALAAPIDGHLAHA